MKVRRFLIISGNEKWVKNVLEKSLVSPSRPFICADNIDKIEEESREELKEE